MTKNVVGKARCTDHIKRRVTQSIFRAFDFAAATGRPMNRYVVIHLSETDAACAATLFERIRHKFRDWLAYHGKRRAEPVAPAYVYTFENPTGENPHVNWALHVPEDLMADFLRKLPRWIERVQGPLTPFTYREKPIRASHANRLAKYLVKGTEPAFLEHFFLREMHDEHGPQGEIWGKRAGVSPALGHTVRRAAAFRPRRRRSEGDRLAA
ncbi:hypothetical protein L598_005000000040 [Mesorhizobium sp. J18]|nr:hypothetical protein L598_005000000040 [Mesorhizobium sp. J18]